MTPRLLRDVLILLVLALLPGAIAGCSARPAQAETHHLKPVPHQPPTMGTTAAAPPPAAAERLEPGRPPLTREQARIATPGTEVDFRRREGSPAMDLSALVPPQSLPAPHEELWVIQRSPPRADAATNDTPGTGGIVVPSPDGKLVPIPLRHTDVKAAVTGYIATVDVTQQFHNPYDGKIEAIYVFPLPHNAAVKEFVMTVGDRRIRGIIREREEAKQVYEQAKRQGYVASLLEQERPNVFTQKVANIEPGKQIDVTVRYFHTLDYSDGWYEWVFPMVVGPRFNPPGTTEGVGAVGRGDRGKSGQKTEVPYLRPGERSGQDIDVAVNLDALVPVETVESRTHNVVVAKRSPRRFDVSLHEADCIPNRDLVLRWKVAGEGIKSGLIVHPDKDGGGYFSMMLVPPDDLRRLRRSPVEMVFAFDVSGSMNGRPIEQARKAVRYALTHMRPEDTFQIVRFAGNATTMADCPLAATPDNVRAALRYLESTEAGGGTMMLEGLRAALAPPADESRPRYVVFLTDGFVGNEADILGALQRMLGGSRVFSFGVGTSTNRYLLEHMAKLGRGAVTYLDLKDDAEEVMAAYFGRISHPALADLSVDWGGAQVDEVYPRRLGDLFVGRPVTLAGRFRGEPPAVVKVAGTVRGEEQVLPPVDVETDADGAASAALPPVWARMKLADLGDRLAYESNNTELPAEIKQVALEYGLMSSFTAFVAVDSLTRTAGDHGTTVGTPVPVPEGVKYETTVPE